MSAEVFKLSATLKGHEDDVRAVLFPSPDLVVSSSRDTSVRLWTRNSGGNTFDGNINSASGAFVNSLAWIPPTNEHPKGLVASGGHDTIIEVREPLGVTKPDPEFMLLGHAHNVCALDALGNIVISGSWDSKARVWSTSNWETIHLLEGHEASVWGVLILDDHTVVTASADKTIRIWRDGKQTKVIQAHTDVVRGLCRLPDGGFASCSNDATVRIWTQDGEPLQELHGHTNFIYSIAALPNGDIVSSGEDRTVRVWRNGECIQTISHPAISVWAVAVCPESGDIVSGSSDRTVRVFSRNPDRWADAATIKEFEDSVSSSAIPSNQVGDVNKEKLPGPEALRKPGNKDGQVIMVRNGDVVEAHMWSQADGQWTNVGTVVDAVGSSRKKEYNGKEYDYVFDVDIKEGSPPLKLPYNASENPYEAATRFLANNELSMTYLDTVAQFIISNSAGTTIGQQQSAPDPDPYGTESRYRIGDESGQSSKPRITPQKTYLQITQAKLPLLKQKLEELNSGFLTSDKGRALNPDDMSLITNLIDALENKKGLAMLSKIAIAAMETLYRVITTWEPAQRIPALDLLRLTAAACPIPATFEVDGQKLADILELVGVFDKAQPNNAMLGVRAFVNMFDNAKSREYLEANYEQILRLAIDTTTGSANKALRIATATLVLNYAVLFSTKKNASAAQKLLPYLSSTITNDSDGETVYRAIVAAGTLLHMGGEVRSAAIGSLKIGQAVEKAMGRLNEARIKEVGREVKATLGTTGH